MTATLRLVSDPIDGPGASDLDDYLKWARELRGLRPNTLKTRQGVLSRTEAALGKPLVQATEQDLLRWEQHYVAGRKPETRRAYIAHVHAFFLWAVKTRRISADPSTCLTQPRLTQGLPRPIPEEDLRHLVASTRPKVRLMILLAAFCGLRCQEVAGLHWTDLRTDGDMPVLLVREGKGGKERTVPVPAVALEAMIAFGRRRSGPIFYGQDARQMDSGSVSRSINRTMRKMGVDATAHQLRHRYATTAYQLTKDIRMIQELLGHSSPQTTARYAAYDKTQTAVMVRAMDEAWATTS